MIPQFQVPTMISSDILRLESLFCWIQFLHHHEPYLNLSMIYFLLQTGNQGLKNKQTKIINQSHTSEKLEKQSISFYSLKK